MSIIRVHKTNNFTVMSNTHFKEKAMSLKAKGLLSLMLSLPDDWNYSISGLVRLSKDGKDSVMTALAELEEFGYLTRHRTTDSKGKFSGVEYNIFEQPQRDNPSAENPNSAIQNADKPNEENQTQLNTNELSINNKELKELNTNKNNRDINSYSSILSQIVNEQLRNLYVDYIEMRRNMGSPITDRGLNMLITRCERISAGHIEKQKRLLEVAIINGWKNVYEPEVDEVKNEQVRALKEIYFGD
jgi:hypothetical protein